MKCTCRVCKQCSRWRKKPRRMKCPGCGKIRLAKGFYKHISTCDVILTMSIDDGSRRLEEFEHGYE